MDQDYLKQLKLGCNKLALAVSDDQYSKLHHYICLLLKWNKVYNLTSITKQEEIISKHILDSLSIIKYIDECNVIDIGSGAGLPGIIIAILKPDTEVKLLDSNSKKTSFLQQVKIELKLANAEIITQRIQDYKPDGHFSIIISRAFASIGDFANVSQHILAENGKILAMKGKISDTEISEFNDYFKNNEFKISDIYKLNVPFLNEDRHLLVITKVKI